MRSICPALAVLALSVAPSIAQAPNWLTRTVLPAPTARNDWGAAYDLARQRTVVFGGFLRGVGVSTDETWELECYNWTRRFPATSPSARLQHDMVYDVAQQHMLMFGGLNSTGLLADTWTYDGVTWTQLSPAASPPARSEHCMAYDLGRSAVVMFGGGGVGGVPLGDTWEFAAGNWVQRTPATSPQPRCCSKLVYDLGRGVSVMFAGITVFSPATPVNDTWEWNGTTWSQKLPVSSPPARGEHGMGYHIGRGRVVVYGGGDGAGGFRDDTWEYDGVTWTQIPTANNFGTRWGMELVYDQRRDRIVRVGINTIDQSVSVYGAVVPARTTTSGTGCPGSSASVPLLSVGSPFLGNTSVQLVIALARPNAPCAVAVSLPAPAQPVGPCTLHVAAPMLLQFGNTGPVGVANFSMAIPCLPALVGLPLHAQGLIADPAAAVGFATTRYVAMTVGD